MRRTTGTAVLVAMLLFAASSARAQALPADSWVLPGGTVRVGLAMDYTHFERRFGATGLEPWSADLSAPLNATNFAPLAGVRSRIDEFITATGGSAAVAAQALSLGEPRIDLSADSRWVPVEVALGVLPRVEVGLVVPIYRSELRVSRFELSGGTVGANPAPDANAAALAQFGERFEALGRSRLLPLAGSTLGAELEARVAAAGGELQLPETAADDSLLNALLVDELGMPPIETHLDTWRLADMQVQAKASLLSTLGPTAFPTDSAPMHYRLSAIVGVRLPTGSEPDTLRLFSPSPAVGLTGWSAGLAGDLFLGQRVWIGAAASYAATGGVDVLRRVSPADEPLASSDAPSLVRWSPPAEMRLRVSPRWRLEESIALALDYELMAIGRSTFEGLDGGAAARDFAGGSVQRVGGSIRFTTLPAETSGSRVTPFEATVSYNRTLSGPAGHPAATTLSVGARLYHRFWGGQPAS